MKKQIAVVAGILSMGIISLGTAPANAGETQYGNAHSFDNMPHRMHVDDRDYHRRDDEAEHEARRQRAMEWRARQRESEAHAAQRAEAREGHDRVRYENRAGEGYRHRDDREEGRRY